MPTIDLGEAPGGQSFPRSREEAVALGHSRYHGRKCPRCGSTLKRTRKYDCHPCHVENHVKGRRKTPSGAAVRKEGRLAYKERLKIQTPLWAEKSAIARLYAEAKMLGLEVDHIAPLAGEEISGLHVRGNLQLLTAEQNRAKGNRFDPAWLGSGAWKTPESEDQ